MRQIISALAFIFIPSSFFAQGIPSKRAHHQLVYDAANRTVLMTGGSTDTKAFSAIKKVLTIAGHNMVFQANNGIG